MKYPGASVYDNPDFFKKYIQKRQKGNTPNDLLDKPYINQLVGKVQNKHILDIGCGDGLFGKSLLEKGAASYHGIDGSKNMIALAKQNLSTPNCVLEEISIETFHFPINQFDVIVSRLVFHYIEDLKPIFQGIYKSLKKNGILVFSIEHPIITSCYDAYHQKTKRSSWIVDNYFHSGERTNIWIEKEVVKYHRTISEYFQLIQSADFQLLKLEESKPIKALFEDQKDYERRMRIPLFMFLKLQK